jgi:hypothetical protein
MSRRTSETAAWLQGNPSLEDLVEAFPAEWDQVQGEVGTVVGRNDATEIKAYISRVANPEPALRGRNRSAGERLTAEIRRQMTVHLLKQAILSSTTVVTEGRVRFGLAAGFLAQRLLFERDLVRKPVSLRAFKLFWPLLGRQRRLLMPLVQPRGVWCFYSQPLISNLAAMIGDRTCVEIAAGDGTLSRFLAGAGVNVTATDDYSWSDSIAFPDSVVKMDARTALRKLKPETVICSWPPAGNTFEQHVFATPSVRLYVVIGSRHEASSGNWAAYRAQTGFTLTERDDLRRLVLPPEVDHGVFVFTRAEGTEQGM